jgi:hypothetical protein
MNRAIAHPCLAILLLGCATVPCRAEVILNYDPAVYNRFTGGFPADPSTTVNNPTFYQSSLDFSGVGWKLPDAFGPGVAWNVTMIDSQHFIGAWHVVDDGAGNHNISIGDTVNFRPSTSSTILSRTIVNLQQVRDASNNLTDVMLGTLNQAFLPTDGVASYPITAAGVPQQQMLVYGRQSAVGRNNVSGLQPNTALGSSLTTALLYDYDQPPPVVGGNPDGVPSTVGGDESHLEGGDSGSPSFVLVGGQLQLIGDHLGIASYSDASLPNPTGTTDFVAYSFDSYLPAYIVQINALTAVPEPSSLAFGALVVGGAAARWVRSRRGQAPA